MSLSSAAANAGLCAALAAAERGTRVLLLERAPESERGGNSFVTPGVFRFPYEGVEDVARLVAGGRSAPRLSRARADRPVPGGRVLPGLMSNTSASTWKSLCHLGAGIPKSNEP